ncbi:undecaprenyl pyrophosphatase synthetase [Encephalitozoon romaleae SJ-2008]|uniref:Undecaprenyl pyrophosphatase synthetase n=1 Tax=Encephalitozoon romaleae (strain SJ-2008) TaxID=1178016 RepID=I7AGB8_ENCRO|nr:undecaprenyl pyrophosphatase synthetase [Encephalitozoon romaleae SJ-2008]AFN83805.1 undecaprenyl pyrophosphatase synthetase [Encephalitozoon romaleae SJ-2008]
MLKGLKIRSLVCIVEIIEGIINNIHIIKIALFMMRILKGAYILIWKILCMWNGRPYNYSTESNRRSRLTIFKNMNVAFICDGNRRYMKKLGLEDRFTKDEGLQKVYEFINFGYFYGFEEISFFCFALNNLKRTPDEVNGMMEVVKKKVKEPKEVGIRPRFRIYGRLDLLEEDVRNRLMDIERESRNNTDIIVNIFFAYSSEDEISRGIQFNSRVDILIRTGDTKRLSNFMIRQVAKGTSVFFAKPLWPELTTAHLFLILLKHRLEDRYLLN